MTTPAGSIDIADALGARHPAAGPAPRIASLVPSLTELIFALDLGDRLVARTRFCIHPVDGVDAVPAVGGTKKAHMERLRELAPTHALLDIDENTRAMDEAIRTFVPHVVVTHPRHPDDNRHLYRLFGGIFGKEERAAELEAAYDAARAAVAAEAARLMPLNVVYFIWKQPWMTVSQDTYISAMFELVGWRTLCHDPGRRYPEIEITPALVEEADLFLFSSEPYAFGAADLDAFAETYGAPRAKLRLIDGEYCSWPGSRAIDGLRYLLGFAKATG